jgi:hypothetical protein
MLTDADFGHRDRPSITNEQSFARFRFFADNGQSRHERVD